MPCGKWSRPLLLGMVFQVLFVLSAAAEPITLRFSHFLGPTSFFQRDLVEPWARDLEKRTDGRVLVEVLNASSPLGRAENQSTQVKTGVVDIALGLRGAEGSRFMRSSIIELPFAVADAHSGSRALWSLHQRGVISEEYADFKVLALFVHNPGLVHTKDKRVVTPSDLKGLRLRAPNATVAAMLDAVGAVPRFVAHDAIVGAVQSRQLDGVVTNWGTPIEGFNEALPRHTAVPFYASAFFIVMNRQRYEELPPDIRQAIDGISGSGLVDRFGPLWDQWDKPYLNGASAPGQEVIRPDAEVLKAWKDGLKPAADRLIEDLRSRGFLDARDVYNQLVKSPSAP